VSVVRELSLAGLFFNVRTLIRQRKPGGDVETYSLIVLLGVWMAASSGSGFLLALLAKRVHPGLSMVKLWLFYTVLMALLAAVVFLIGWF